MELRFGLVFRVKISQKSSDREMRGFREVLVAGVEPRRCEVLAGAPDWQFFPILVLPFGRFL